ncbi:sensor histidine kinase [Halosimplex halobium]|uniref:sensor histidine kinase n=1 Tax=Halosimplex halobium TaxID=3396618 RepID=UPI003F55D302
MQLVDPIVVAYLLTAVVTGVVAARSARIGHVDGARSFAAAMGAVAAWALLSVLVQYSLSRGGAVFSLLNRLTWFPVGAVAVAWLCFGLAYSGRGEWVTARRVAVLSVVPGATALLGLCHPDVLDAAASMLAPLGLAVVPRALSPLAAAWDTASLVTTGYAYLLVAAGSLLLLEMIVERPLAHAGQLLLVAVVVPPWVLNALHLFVFDLHRLNPTILGFAVSGVAGLFAVGRFRLFDVPLARARLVEELDSGVVVYGRDGRVYDYNERAVSLLGRSDGDLSGDVRRVLAESPLAVDPPADAPLFADRPAEPDGDGSDRRGERRGQGAGREGDPAAADGGTAPLAERLEGRTVAVRDRGDDDRSRYVETRLSDLSNASGRPVSRVLRLYDVTDRERRKRDLERSRERYRTIFENNQVMIWEFDLSAAKRRAERVAEGVDDLASHLAANPETHREILDGMEPLAVNERAVEFYGAPSKAALRANVERIMTEDSIASLRGLWAAVVAGETHYRSQCHATTFDGESKYVILEVTVPPSHGDDYARAFMSTVDVTERVERERELQRRNEYLDEFTSVVSHDIATPLSTIRNKAHLVELTGDPDHAADIHETAERVQHLVDDLLELARQGKRVGETEPVDLGTVARQAWRSVDPADASLAVESTARVEADPERLRQLLENLLVNAVEHGSTSPGAGTRRDAVEHDSADAGPERSPAPGGSSPSVRVGAVDGGFYVADDGPGVPPDERDRVFDRGYTGDGDGTGLGLAIVERIAEAHGWSVKVTESEAGGARFEVREATVEGTDTSS